MISVGNREVTGGLTSPFPPWSSHERREDGDRQFQTPEGSTGRRSRRRFRREKMPWRTAAEERGLEGGAGEGAGRRRRKAGPEGGVVRRCWKGDAGGDGGRFPFMTGEGQGFPFLNGDRMGRWAYERHEAIWA